MMSPLTCFTLRARFSPWACATWGTGSELGLAFAQCTPCAVSFLLHAAGRGAWPWELPLGLSELKVLTFLGLLLKPPALGEKGVIGC